MNFSMLTAPSTCRHDDWAAWCRLGRGREPRRRRGSCRCRARCAELLASLLIPHRRTALPTARLGAVARRSSAAAPGARSTATAREQQATAHRRRGYACATARDRTGAGPAAAGRTARAGRRPSPRRRTWRRRSPRSSTTGSELAATWRDATPVRREVDGRHPDADEAQSVGAGPEVRSGPGHDPGQGAVGADGERSRRGRPVVEGRCHLAAGRQAASGERQHGPGTRGLAIDGEHRLARPGRLGAGGCDGCGLLTRQSTAGGR